MAKIVAYFLKMTAFLGEKTQGHFEDQLEAVAAHAVIWLTTLLHAVEMKYVPSSE